MNMNRFAKRITLQEGKKVNLSIAQVKEVIKLTLQELSKEKDLWEVMKILSRYAAKKNTPIVDNTNQPR